MAKDIAQSQYNKAHNCGFWSTRILLYFPLSSVCPPFIPGLLWISMVTKITLHVEICIYRCLNSFKPLSQLKENEVVTQISAFLQQFQQSIFPKWGGKSRSKSLLLVLPTVIVHYLNKTYFHHHHRDHHAFILFLIFSVTTKHHFLVFPCLPS